MRNVKYILAIIASISMVFISIVLPFIGTHFSDISYISGSLVGIGATLLGSFVVMWYETSKEYTGKVEKRKNALAVVYNDITQSLHALETAPKKGILMIHQLSRIGWDILAMSGSFNLRQELDHKIADVYERLRAFNAMINWNLSMYFTSGEEETGFRSRAMQGLKELIHNQIEILLPCLKTVQKEIERELGLPQVGIEELDT